LPNQKYKGKNETLELEVVISIVFDHIICIYLYYPLCNFAGGQGFFNSLTFIAPYLEGRPYEEIEQLMQIFVWNEGKKQELLDRMRYGADDVR
jgi:anaerobic ribonucleoside-triphosphate reductase